MPASGSSVSQPKPSVSVEVPSLTNHLRPGRCLRHRCGKTPLQFPRACSAPGGSIEVSGKFSQSAGALRHRNCPEEKPPTRRALPGNAGP